MGSIKRVCIYFLKKCLKSHIDHAIKHFDILGTTCTLRPICIFCFKLSMIRDYIIHSKYHVFIVRVGNLIINCRYTISNHPMNLLHPFTKEWTIYEQTMDTTCSSSEVEVTEEGKDGEMTARMEMDIEHDSKMI